MGNQQFYRILTTYHGADEAEERSRLDTIKLLETKPRCFENDAYEPGHITGSAFVVDSDLTETLLTHHGKIKKWLQFGGHSDGHDNPFETAMREAEEESGLSSLHYFSNSEEIFDMDVHEIPSSSDAPAHNHYDIRVLLAADRNEPFAVTHESDDLRWAPLEKVHHYNSEPAFLRMANKAIALRQKRTS